MGLRIPRFSMVNIRNKWCDNYKRNNGDTICYTKQKAQLTFTLYGQKEGADLEVLGWISSRSKIISLSVCVFVWV